MRKLLGLAIIVGLAAVLILTKPTPKEIALAAAGDTNTFIVNRDKMSREFIAAAAAAAVIQSVGGMFPVDAKSLAPSVKWRVNDLIVLMYSDVSLAGTGSLKCAWLLRSGFCIYMPQ